ncbi:MAG: hypothetical protein AAGD22_18465 [Verrucomicrobiota bacterium]
MIARFVEGDFFGFSVFRFFGWLVGWLVGWLEEPVDGEGFSGGVGVIERDARCERFVCVRRRAWERTTEASRPYRHVALEGDRVNG